MKRVLFVLLTPVWLAVVFLVVFRLTFPSDALVSRASYEVANATGGTMALQMASATPAWMGLTGHELLLSSVEEGVATPVLAVEKVKVAGGLMSLISGSPSVGGYARFGDGRLNFDTTIAGDDAGVYDMRALDVDAQGFPLSALPPIQGTKILGTGGFDLVVDLDVPDGYAKSNGRASLSGANIELSGVSGDMNAIVTGFGILPATLQNLDLEFEIREGKAEVRRGTLVSSLADVTIEGDIVLTNRLSNSRLRLDLVIDAKEPLQGIASMMASAKWDTDEKYHYELRGNFNRPSFSPARNRTASRTRPRPASRPSGRGRNNADDEPEVAAPRGSQATRDRAQAAREQLRLRGGQTTGIERAGGVLDGPNILGDGPSVPGQNEGDTAEPAADPEEAGE